MTVHIQGYGAWVRKLHTAPPMAAAVTLSSQMRLLPRHRFKGVPVPVEDDADADEAAAERIGIDSE